MEKFRGSLSPVPKVSGNLSGTGTMAGSLTIPQVAGAEYYRGDYVATPKVTAEVFPTKNKTMIDDFTVLEIPRWEVSNEYGKTFIIGDE